MYADGLYYLILQYLCNVYNMIYILRFTIKKFIESIDSLF